MVEAQLHEKSQQEADKLKQFQKSVRQGLIKSRDRNEQIIEPIIVNHKVSQMVCNSREDITAGEDTVTSIDSNAAEATCSTRQKYRRYKFISEDKIKMAQKRQVQTYTIKIIYGLRDRELRPLFHRAVSCSVLSKILL